MSAEKTAKPLHAVIYTDGGCRSEDKNIAASRGVGGWGIHGYLFYDEPASQGSGCKGYLPTAKGYVQGESGKTPITLVEYVDGVGSLVPESTNNIAEIVAAQRAFKVCIDKGVCKVIFAMDSEYTLNGLREWAVKWERENWIKPDGTPRANAELWKELMALKAQLEATGCEITYTWVKGHDDKSRFLGNEIADRLATNGVFAGQNGQPVDFVKFTDAKGYWSAKADRNRMFGHPNWYFSAQNQESRLSDDGRHIYYLGDPREDEELHGKKIPDATFSVLYLKEADPALTSVFDCMAEIGKGQYQGISIGRLDKIFLPGIYNELSEHKDKFLQRLRREQKVQNADKTVLAAEKRPAHLLYHAMEALQSLENMLCEYLKPSENTRLRATDITDLLYESESGKKKVTVKLKPHVTSAFRSMDVSANFATENRGTEATKLVLTLGLDMPDRNTLSALSDESTRVTVLTWPESPSAIRYATVVESGGDAGIWSGIYANLHMLAR